MLKKAKNKRKRKRLYISFNKAAFPFLLIVVLQIFACTSLPRQKWDPASEGLPLKVVLIDVPFFPQEEFQCGPAAIAMVLRWSGLPVAPDRLKEQIFTPSRKGSIQPDLISAVRRHGRVAYEIFGPYDLMSEVAAGHPVVVLQNLGFSWYPVWHYAVVIGYDMYQDVVFLHSGNVKRKRLALAAFQTTWQRSACWGLTVLDPSQLPVTAKEESYITAVMGLERARQWNAAIKGYETFLLRWPNNSLAHIGLGNSYYKMGDLKSAENAYRSAALKFPQNPTIFNNLAQTLLEQGRKEEAISAAKKAIELGGPLIDEYTKTLEEILSQNNDAPFSIEKSLEPSN